MNSIWLFVATFALVFIFGFLTHGGYRAAFVTTFAIGVAYLVIFRYLPVVTAADIAGYLIGGPCGIVASMALRRWVARAVAVVCGEITQVDDEALNKARGGG